MNLIRYTRSYLIWRIFRAFYFKQSNEENLFSRLAEKAYFQYKQGKHYDLIIIHLVIAQFFYDFPMFNYGSFLLDPHFIARLNLDDWIHTMFTPSSTFSHFIQSQYLIKHYRLSCKYLLMTGRKVLLIIKRFRNRNHWSVYCIHSEQCQSMSYWHNLWQFWKIFHLGTNFIEWSDRK